jgi:hypothetical protein
MKELTLNFVTSTFLGFSYLKTSPFPRFVPCVSIIGTWAFRDLLMSSDFLSANESDMYMDSSANRQRIDLEQIRYIDIYTQVN